MSRRFEDLCEHLLQSGVAPRHVRRYERELEEHLDDLVAMQKARGYDGEDAAIRARALLGPDDELAGAMTARREFRSLAARAPWLVFGLAPPVMLLALLLSVGFSLVALWYFALGHQILIGTLPAWLQTTSRLWCTAANFGSGPLAAVFFVILAVHQRQNWHWPAFAVGVTALLSAFTTFAVRFPQTGRLGEISVGLSASSLTLGENLARVSLNVVVVIASYALLRRQIRTLA